MTTNMKRQALDALAKRYPEDFARIYEAVRRGEQISEVTVREWAEKWLAMRVHQVRPGTWDCDKSVITARVLPVIGDKPLSALQRADIRAVHDECEKAGLALTSIARTHASLMVMLRAADDEGFEVPARTLRAPGPSKTVRTDRVALSVEQARAILRVAMRRPDASRWVAAMLQGMRPAEARGLRWQDVDLQSGVMRIQWQLKQLPYREKHHPETGFRVPRGFESIHLERAYHLVRPKTASGVRTVPLVPWLRTELAAWSAVAPQSPFDLVWTCDGHPMSADVDRATWRKIVDEAGVMVTTPAGKVRAPLLYECRHTAATLLAASGTDDTTLTAIVGHSKILSTQTYLHTDEARKLEALERSSEMLGVAA